MVKALRAGSKIEDEKNNVIFQLRNEQQNYNNDMNSAMVARVRLTNRVIELENASKLIEEDAKKRMEEFRKHPIIAAMTDQQVQILAEMLVAHIRQLMEEKKEYVN